MCGTDLQFPSLEAATACDLNTTCALKKPMPMGHYMNEDSAAGVFFRGLRAAGDHLRPEKTRGSSSPRTNCLFLRCNMKAPSRA